MKNKISVNVKNSQKIGQNSVSQPSQIPEKPKVNYWIISTLILAALFFGILGLYIFSSGYKTNQSVSTINPTQSPIDISPTDTQKQRAEVFIQLEKTTYRPGEPIVFTITNNTQQNVYYFPETCASSLVQVFISPDDNSIPIHGDQKVCMLVPTVETLLLNGNITSKIPDKTLSNMVPGRYKIKFYYSLEKRDRFALGEQSIVESEILTISK